MYISFEEEPDIIVINFADEDFFITDDGIKIHSEQRVLTRRLMR